MLQILGHRVLMFNATIYIYMLSYHTSERTWAHVHSFHLCAPFCKSTSTLVCCKADWIWCRLANAASNGDDAWRLTAMMAATRNAPQSQGCYCVCFHCLGVRVYDKPKMTWPEPHGFSGERLKSYIINKTRIAHRKSSSIILLKLPCIDNSPRVYDCHTSGSPCLIPVSPLCCSYSSCHIALCNRFFWGWKAINNWVWKRSCIHCFKIIKIYKTSNLALTCFAKFAKCWNFQHI